MKNLNHLIDKLPVSKFVLVLAVVLSVSAWYWSFTNNFVLTYNDAASHLNIARRIVDNYTPGFAQIGTVWLPLPHFLMLFFAWNDFLWKTAIAGSIVSMASYVICVFFTFKTIHLLTKSKIGALIGALVMALNPNFLYLQASPMTEPLLLATFVTALYFLCRYWITKNTTFLILTGASVMLSTLVRYDGWFLFIVLLILIPLAGFLRDGFKRAEGEVILFATIGGLGVGLWLLWNWTIFGDPLYFILGPYSAYAQQKVLDSVGQLPTKGNWFNAAFYFTWSVIGNNGIVITVTGLIASVVSIFLVKKKVQILLILAVLSPFAFNVLALYIGQSAMNVPQALKDPGMFNIRYGIMLLPAFSLLLGIIASRVKVIGILIVAGIIIIQSYLFYQEGKPISLQDGIHGYYNTYYTVEVSKWLSDNYEGGLILTALASHDAFVARAQIPMKNYIHEGNRQYWENALKTPSKSIEYIALLTFPPDAVYKRLKNNPDFKNNYVKVHNYKEFEIYKKKN